MVDWLQHVDPKEEWILVLDSDMYLRKPFYPQFFNATPGWCISADYTYMIGAQAPTWDGASRPRPARCPLGYVRHLVGRCRCNTVTPSSVNGKGGLAGVRDGLALPFVTSSCAYPPPGVNNELAVRHIPEIGPRNDTLAGPYGRRGDQVGHAPGCRVHTAQPDGTHSKVLVLAANPLTHVAAP